MTKESIKYIKLLQKSGFEPSTQRDLSLLNISCINYAYNVNLKKYLDFNYTGLAVIGNKQGWYSYLNRKHVIEKTGKFVSTAKNLKLFFIDLEKEANRLRRQLRLASKRGNKKLLEIVNINKELVTILAVYNSFWRYIGDDAKGKGVNSVIRQIGQGRNKSGEDYYQIERLIGHLTKELGRSRSFNGELLRSCTVSELERFLKQGLSINDVVELKRRQNNYFYFADGKKETVTSEPAIVKEIQTGLDNLFSGRNEHTELLMLSKSAYLKTVRRPYPPLFSSMFMHGYRNPGVFKGFVNGKYAMRDLMIIDGVWYYPKQPLKTAGKLAYESWYEPKRFRKITSLLKKRERSLISSTAGNFSEYSTAYEAYMPALLLVWGMESLVTKGIRKLFRMKLSQQDIEKLIDVLNVPLHDNYYKKEEKDLLNAKDLKGHVQKYEWINSRYGEIKPYIVAQARAKLKSIDKTKFLREWNAQKRQVTKAIADAKRLLSPSDRVIVDLMQFIIYYRTQRTDVINMSHYLFFKKLKALAKDKHVSYHELLHCTKEEILGKMPSKNELQQRLKDYAVVMQDGKISCVSGNELVKLKKLFSEDLRSMKEVQGKVAYAGKTKGRVKLIMGTKDFIGFEKDEILVTAMTSPHMVPIMKKASAFVTDEGGITCHAAIMSREMRKPCVIGTKIATKIFKDGDLVEVDANKGIVRKLK